jgi:hypothetical protein
MHSFHHTAVHREETATSRPTLATAVQRQFRVLYVAYKAMVSNIFFSFTSFT